MTGARRALVVLALCCECAGVSAGPSYIERSEKRVLLGNEFLELCFEINQEKCAATRLVNKLNGRTILLKADDFSIGLEERNALCAADFGFKEAKEGSHTDGRQLCLQFDTAGTRAQQAAPLHLQIVYELGNHDFFLRRRIEVSAGEPQVPLPVRQVDVWVLRLEGQCSHQGFGEPVFMEDLFLGLEFPGAHNTYADGVAKLSQFPGRTTMDRFVSKSAVLGVAEPGRVAQRFRQYVETFQVTPKDKRLFVNYNTWWTLMPPTEENCLALIKLFKEKLYDPYGESFDTFTIDDGWDNKNSLWEIRGDRFPRGFAPLVDALKAMNANLGLWLSPSSGYNHAPWGGTHGYEQNSNAWFLCQSGPKYRRDIVKVVTGLESRYDLAFFKFDGFCAGCEAKNHGHLPGEYAREANIDAYIELLTAVRKVRPDIYLDPTCGIWLSPWWLKYADSLWGSVSGDYPDIVVPAPILRDSATTTRDGVFGQRCEEHPGYPPSAIEHLGIIVITDEKWEDNAMAVVGRGCRLLTLYINPKFFKKGDRDWAFLASVLKWVRHNAETLERTELIPGDPFKREAYGFAHFRGQRGILSLRNPFIEPKTVKLTLDESVGWTRSEAELSPNGFVARVVYPREEVLEGVLRYGDTLTINLQAYEVVTIHAAPVSVEEPLLLGARYHETERTGNRVSYAVYGRAGRECAATVAGLSPTKATMAGREIHGVASEGRVHLPFVFDGENQGCAVEGAQLAPDESGAAKQLVGRCTATVPTAAKASMHLLCDLRASVGQLTCSAQVNGKAVPVRATRSPKDRAQTYSQGPWVWFEFDVPPGRSDVSVAVKPPDGGLFLRAEVGWWLWVEHPLTKKVLTLEFDRPLAGARNDPLPIPVNMETEREILIIQPLRTFHLGTRWGNLGQPVVYLNEAPPDEVSQDWGKLQLNQSVWQKEMIVAGRKFSRGLGTHANGRIVYDLSGGKFRTFRSLVGRDEHAGDGRVVFQVLVDGKKVFDSGPMTRTSPPKQVEVDVAAASTLELVTKDGGDGVSGDHGDWAEAQLAR